MNTPTQQPAAAFLEGSVLRHVLVMTATGSVGLISVFIVDLLTLIYISWLGDRNLTAAIGFATQISFLFISIQIGLSIAITALVARRLGAGQRDAARRIAASSLIHIGVITLLVTIAALPFIEPTLKLIGARGETLRAAVLFLEISLPSNVLLALAMATSGILRAAGDARRSMYVLLGGAVVTALLDPVLILYLRWDVAGAAISTVFARAVMAATGFWGVTRVHRLIAGIDRGPLLSDLKPLLAIALPAIAANIAAPVAMIYALKVFAGFGAAAVAAFAIIDRVVPVAFGPTFAMSGAVGPVIGQNFGARRFRRVRDTLTASYRLTLVYGFAVWALLALGAPLIVNLFGATGETAELAAYFCRVGAGSWAFLGCLFAANAAFNNLGYPMLAMAFNWGRATLGTIPFVTVGASIGGPKGAIFGMAIGAAIFGLVAIATSYWIAARLGARSPPAAREKVAT